MIFNDLVFLNEFQIIIFYNDSMIKVINLTKVYKTDKEELTALNNVSFTLPDKGLVFVVGKSGSGKSTLINMLGGLDDITNGDVFVDNLNIAKLSVSDLDKFRNHYLGIIYQNYNLFENEKVIDNVKAASNIAGLKIEDAQIDSILKDLDLDDIKNKLVKHLSGGQKQRVAIARALIKNPRFILADEPTGNLDTKTAKIIFDLLKKISKDRLVVIISHDLKSSYEYADRILKISDGQIIEDIVRNESFVEDDQGYLLLDEDMDVSSEDVEKINESLKQSKYKIKKKQKAFVSFKDSDKITSSENINLKETKHNLKPSFSTALKFIKNNITSLIITVLLSTMMIGLLSLSMSFTSFDGDAAVKSVVAHYDAKAMVVRKGYSFTSNINNISKDYLIETDIDDENTLKKGYEGNVYPIYSVSLPIYDYLLDGAQTFKDLTYKNVYGQSALGVIGCDSDYLKHVFGDDFEVVAGSLYGLEESTDIIVPDYFADGMIYGDPKLTSSDPNDPYQKILGVEHFGRYTIGAIIKTNYREKYDVFLKAIQRMAKEPHNASEIQKQMVSSQLFIDFQDDANSYLNFGYSINPNFLNQYCDECSYFAYFINTVFTDSEDAKTSRHTFAYQGDNVYATNVEKYGEPVELKDDEVLIRTQLYNDIFETQVTSTESPDFEVRDLYIHSYGFDQNTTDTPRYTVKLKVVGVENYSESHIAMRMNTHSLSKLRKTHNFVYGYAIDNVNEAYKVYNNVRPYYFFNTLNCFDAVFNTINIVSIFSDIFFILAIVMTIVLFLIIVLHNLKVIKKEQYRIGVYKSLGYSNRLLTISMVINNMFIILLIFSFSTLFAFGTSFLANYLLQLGFATYMNNTVYFELTLLAFKIEYALIFNIATLVFTLSSSFIPLLAIRKIKPNKIIRNAE